MQGKRVEYIDVARGLTVIMMICFHVLGETIPVLHHFFACTVVFVFLVSSGYFCNSFSFAKLIKKLVLTYFVMLWFVRIIWWIRFREFSSGDIKDIVYQMIIGRTVNEMWPSFSLFVGIIWFLPLLFTSRIIYFGIRSISKDNLFLRGIICIAVTACGMLLGVKGFSLPWYVGEAAVAIGFFFFGDLMHERSEIFIKAIKSPWSAPVVLLGWGILTYCFGYGELTSYGTYPYGLTWIFASAMTVFFVFSISYHISSYLKHASAFLQFYGRNLFPVYMMHVIDKSCITGPTDFNIYLLFLIELFIASVPVIVIVLLGKKNG